MPKSTTNTLTPRSRAATLADVGRVAGVSAMAVSAVLNGARTSSRIALETRERILAAAAKLRYRPNAAARALASRRMHTLGVAARIVPGADINTYTMEIFSGILEAAAHHHQNATMFTLQDWEADVARVHQWCDGRIDGLIMLAPILSRTAARALPTHTPFVALHANSPLANVVNIEADEERGAYDMVRHLIRSGHRRILHLAGPLSQLGGQRRLAGYKAALGTAHIPVRESLIVPTKFTAEAGRQSMHEWLEKYRDEPLPDAVFCANDGIAVGCLEALAERGLRVPDDVSVVGFDDSLAARTTVPQLTTVRQPLRAMGAKAVEVLLARIAAETGAPCRIENPIVFPVELVHRDSVARPARPSAPARRTKTDVLATKSQ